MAINVIADARLFESASAAFFESHVLPEVIQALMKASAV
jgi:hypothetical protein